MTPSSGSVPNSTLATDSASNVGAGITTSGDGHSTDPQLDPSHHPTGSHAYSSPAEAYTTAVPLVAALRGGSDAGGDVEGVAVLTDTVAGTDDDGTELAGAKVTSTTGGRVATGGEVTGAVVGDGDVGDATESAASSSAEPHAANAAKPTTAISRFIR